MNLLNGRFYKKYTRKVNTTLLFKSLTHIQYYYDALLKISEVLHVSS
mgnify:FL=1